MTRKIILDTDPGVDDTMALFMALASPELEIVGLTTIFGNAATEVTTRNALTLLDAAGRPDIPVARGADRPLATDYLGPVPQVHGADGLGDGGIIPSTRSTIESSAHDFIYTTALAAPGEITLLAVGPLTNLALALQAHPDLVDLVDEVVVMGGNALVPGNATPVAEANINNDPEAADIVFGAGWKIAMVGLDVTHEVTLSTQALDRICSADSPTSRLLSKAIPLYRSFFNGRNGVDGIYVHDPSAVAYMLDPSSFVTKQWSLRVETESFSRGKTWPNIGNTDESVPKAWQGRPVVDVCTEVDGVRVAALVEERLTGSA